MSTTGRRPQGLLEKAAWYILIFFSAVVVLFGVGDIIQGMDADPAIVESITGKDWAAIQADTPAEARAIDQGAQAGGVHLVITGAMLLLTALTAFREGSRHAFFLMLALPIWAAFVFVLMFTTTRSPDYPPPPPMLSAPVFIVLTGGALAVSARRFFEANSSRDA